MRCGVAVVSRSVQRRDCPRYDKKIFSRGDIIADDILIFPAYKEKAPPLVTSKPSDHPVRYLLSKCKGCVIRRLLCVSTNKANTEADIQLSSQPNALEMLGVAASRHLTRLCEDTADKFTTRDLQSLPDVKTLLSSHPYSSDFQGGAFPRPPPALPTKPPPTEIAGVDIPEPWRAHTQFTYANNTQIPYSIVPLPSFIISELSHYEIESLREIDSKRAGIHSKRIENGWGGGVIPQHTQRIIKKDNKVVNPIGEIPLQDIIPVQKVYTERLAEVMGVNLPQEVGVHDVGVLSEDDTAKTDSKHSSVKDRIPSSTRRQYQDNRECSSSSEDESRYPMPVDSTIFKDKTSAKTSVKSPQESISGTHTITRSPLKSPQESISQGSSNPSTLPLVASKQTQPVKSKPPITPVSSYSKTSTADQPVSSAVRQTRPQPLKSQPPVAPVSSGSKTSTAHASSSQEAPRPSLRAMSPVQTNTTSESHTATSTSSAAPRQTAAGKQAVGAPQAVSAANRTPSPTQAAANRTPSPTQAATNRTQPPTQAAAKQAAAKKAAAKKAGGKQGPSPKPSEAVGKTATSKPIAKQTPVAKRYSSSEDGSSEEYSGSTET
eukprot:GHVR01041393.1.p1 GENE.GHVR01041393.1~~GHVR01041393.1.p1  ORF type:complete len:604 (-),score=163.53 GHVR01041393.1:128-1939(-)